MELTQTEVTSTPEVKEPVEAPVNSTTNDWADAEAAFDEADEVQPPVQAESHLEQGKEQVVEEVKVDEANQSFNMDKLAVPHKYKPAVEEFVKPILEENKKQLEATSETLEQYKGGLTELLVAFQDIAKNPEKLSEYVSKYGPQIGIDPSTLAQPKQSPQAEVSKEPPVNMDQALARAEEMMVKADNEQDFIKALKARDSVKEQVLMNQFGQLLKSYHEKFIAPDKKTLEDFRTDAEQKKADGVFNSNSSGWKESFTTVKTKYSDFEKYLPQIRQAIKDDPDYSQMRDAINKDYQNPKIQERRDKLLVRVYKEISEADRIEKLKNPKPKPGGLPPTRHITTTKKGGSDWDEIYENPNMGWTE